MDATDAQKIDELLAVKKQTPSTIGELVGIKMGPRGYAGAVAQIIAKRRAVKEEQERKS